MAISKDSTVVVARELVSCDLADEAAILNLKNGVYYGLDAVGARVWDLIQEPRRLGDVRDAIVAEYEVEADRLEADLLQLLRKMMAEWLVELRDDTAG